MFGFVRGGVRRGAGALCATALLAMLVLGLAGCSGGLGQGGATGGPADTVGVASLDASGERVVVEVPRDPRRIAVLDMAALDILDGLGMGGRVVGVADVSIDYLAHYADGSLPSLGTIKEPDLEAVMACEPDVIYIGGRLATYYDQLSAIAPCVQLSVDAERGVVESTVANATDVARLFGLEDEVALRVAALESRIGALREAAESKTALVSLFTSGSVSVLGNDARCSLIGREVGFGNLADSEVTSTHGNEISFETLVAMDPDYVFVLNRDAAIGADGAELAREVMENDLTRSTRAYREGRFVYLSSPKVWYTAEGGLTALDTMVADLEAALL